MSQTSSSTYDHIVRSVAHRQPQEVASDESLWQHVATLFCKPADYVHLEYGYYHPASRPTLETEIALMRLLATQAARYKRTHSVALLERARSRLAATAGVEPTEIAILRNATEAMNTLIQGIALEPGDEIVHGDQDYPSIVEALEQRAARDGVILRTVTLPEPDAPDDEVVAAFAAAMTPRTRLLHVTHMVNFTGRILPVRRLGRLAHEAGAEIAVDAAHAFAQLDFKIPDLECDYLGASLHKWMAAPLGLGLLFCRRDRIPRVRPLMADTRLPRDDIRRLEHVGNRPDPALAGLIEAINLHEAIGPANKHARLHRLQRRWTGALASDSRFELLSPRDAAQHGAIGAFRLHGSDASSVAKNLLERHGVFVTAMSHSRVGGVRATPFLGTLEGEIDRLTAALIDTADSPV